MSYKIPGKFRSSAWFGHDTHDNFVHRSWMRNQGMPDDQFDGRPIIGICNTFSELNPCHAHFRDLCEHVKKGVYESGGVPLEFPVISLGEAIIRPTAMIYRNLMSMDVEEMIRANPIDGVVLLAGCDKNVPASLMGAASCNIPTILVSGGPMLNGKYRDRDLGSGTDVWRYSEERKAGLISKEEYSKIEAGMNRSAGNCNTMGTASTMGCMVESLGMGLPQNAAVPAVDANRKIISRMAGRRIVEMVKEDLKPSDILTKEAFINAIRVNAAIGGSTNAAIHFKAIAGRIGVDLDLEDWNKYGTDVPTILNLMPSGKYLMEDFYYAGGLPAIIRILGEHDLLIKDCITVNGSTIWENNKNAEIFNDEVIKSFDKPLLDKGGLAILKGNLCPDGAVIKPSAASAHLMKHTGKAVVFTNIEDYLERINDPELDIDENSVMVMQNCGPIGYPGMAEVGNMGLPPKILKKGITDMVRISDARMSGTAYGTVVLHITPEADIGGPLALVKNGDMIELDVNKRSLNLLVDESELDKRRKQWKPAPKDHLGGYQKLYVERVLQADQGCDFDFLVGCRGADVPRPSH